MANGSNKLIKENIRVALRSIRSQLLKTIITVMMIMLGISALILINTAAESLKSKVQEEFTVLGSNTFSVYAKNSRSRGGRHGVQSKSYKAIDYYQATLFAEEFEYDAIPSISALGSMTGTVKFGSEKTNPNIRILGGDHNYLEISGYKIDKGRNISPSDIENGYNVVILGADIVTSLFKEFEDPVDQVVSIGDYKYTVIGTTLPKGASIGFSNDNQCIIPLSSLKKSFATKNTSYGINVLVHDAKKLDHAISEARGLLRVIRQDPVGGDASFEIEKSDSTAEMLTELLDQVSWFVLAIGLLTLLGAGIGLMNIMLVSVTERTKEIGIRKALGASSAIIRMQFLIESIVIGQIGGILGIIIGILLGNIASIYLETSFIVPWTWVIVGVILCLATGIASGYYPAKKAAQLDPIDALRYE